MNKKLYVGLYVSGIIAAIVFLVLGGIVSVIATKVKIDGLTTFVIILNALGAISLFAWLIIHIVFYFLTIAKMYGPIQDGYTEVSVGKAIGYLFIPFFNIYWIFKVWGGFPNEYNSYIARNNINVEPLSNGLFIALPITVILTGFYIGFLALPFVMAAVIWKVSDAVNALENAPISANNQYNYPPSPPRQFF